MPAPQLTIVGTLSPQVDGGYLLAELSQPVILTDTTTPAIKYKTLPVPTRGMINTDGRLMAFGGSDPSSHPFKLYPSKGTLVSPSYGAFYTIRAVTTRDGLTTKSKEQWEIDSSFGSQINVASIPLVQFVPTNIYRHDQLSELGDDDHPQYPLVNGTRPFTGDIESSKNDGRLILRTPSGQRAYISLDNSLLITVNTL